jgi:hypothetical protein
VGKLVYFEDHFSGADRPAVSRQRPRGQSLIPLQLALNEYDIERCFSLLASYGRCSVFPRSNSDDAGRILFLVRIEDAIALNQYLLEQDEEDSQAAADRIDLIQMLENCAESLLSKAWDRIGAGPGDGGQDRRWGQSLDRVRQ